MNTSRITWPVKCWPNTLLPFNPFCCKHPFSKRLSGPLCAAVTGDANAAHILETLREKNLFVVALDHQKEWYRYHALFADLLQNRLHQAQAGQVDELHLRASRWYQQNGLLAPAVEHALAGHALEQAAALLEQAVEPVFISGQVEHAAALVGSAAG